MPSVRIYINSIFPVSASAAEKEPALAKIADYNTALQEMCDGKHLGFIDNTALVQENYYEERRDSFQGRILSGLGNEYGGGSNIMTRQRQGIWKAASYAVLLLILGYIALLMIYVSGSNRSFSEMESSMEKVIDTTGMKKLDGQMLKRNFGLNSTDYEGVMYYSSESSIECRGSPDDLCQKEQSDGAGDRCGRTAAAGAEKRF